MQYTTNYNIPKYDGTDLLNPTSREGLNSGSDIIDTQLKSNADAILTKANANDVYSKSQTYTKTEVNTALGNKVDKVNGKGLSTNDYDNTEKGNVASNTSARHTHDNKEFLDTLSQSTLDAKANASDVYSKTDTNNLLNTKADKTTLAIDEKRIKNLELKAEGHTYTLETDSTGNNPKLVPLGADGYATWEKICGKTVAINQLVDKSNFEATKTVGGITFTNNDDGSVTVNGTATTTAHFNFYNNFTQYFTLNHKYLFSGISGGSTSTYYIRIAGGYFDCYNSRIGTCTQAWLDDTNKVLRVTVKGGATVSNVKITPNVFDLTPIENATGLTFTTVADFEAYLTSLYQCVPSYIPYCANTLTHYTGNSIVSKGFNVWDEENNVVSTGAIEATGNVNIYWTTYEYSETYVSVFPNTQYCMSDSVSTAGLYYYFAYYDIDKHFISREGFGDNITSGVVKTTPSNCYYIRIVRPKATHTNYCINLSQTDTTKSPKNGDYRAYWNETKSIPTNTYFADGMKSAGSVSDELTPTKAIKRIGAVDLGTLNWTKFQTLGSNYCYKATISNRVVKVNPSSWAIISNGYTIGGTSTPSEYAINLNTIYFENSTANIYINWATDITTSAFATAMSGVMLYYELATPIETDVTPPIEDTFIQVEGYGSITLPQASGDIVTVPCPTTEVYRVKL